MSIIALPVCLSILRAHSAVLDLALNGAYAFAIFTTNGALWASCFVHVPASMRATTRAMTLLIGGVTGLAVGPALVGGISGMLSSQGGGHALQTSLVIVELLIVG